MSGWRTLAGALAVALALGVAVPALGGSQPSVGVVSYNIDDQISQARDALRLARNTLSQATRKSESLLRQADKTTDLKKKLALLQEVAMILQTSVTLKRQIEDLEESLEKLSVKRDALLTAQRLAEEQRALQTAKEGEFALASAATQLPAGASVIFGLPGVPSIDDIDNLAVAVAGSTVPFVPPVVPREFKSKAEENDFVDYLVENLTDEEVSASRKYADYAVLMNNAYHTPDQMLPLGDWKLAAHRDSISGFSADVYERRNSDDEVVEIVLAFAGTNELLDWPLGNLSPLQESQARDYAADVFRAYFECVSCGNNVAPDVVIKTTGHSLGGALAKAAAPAIKGVAITFDSSWRGSESHQIAQVEEAGEILDIVRADRSTDVSFDLFSGSPISQHTSAYLLARVMSGAR